MQWHIPRPLADNPAFLAVFYPFQRVLAQALLPWIEAFPDRAGFDSCMVSFVFSIILTLRVCADACLALHEDTPRASAV